MSTSFPFLKIARERKIPYGVVIRLAQAIETDNWHVPEVGAVTFEDRTAVLDALVLEKSRRNEILKPQGKVN